MPPVGTSRGVECAAYGCDNRFYNKDFSRSPFHFFSFPADHKLRDRWCMKIKRAHGCDGFFVSKSTQICNVHFKAEDIKKSLTGIWRLKPGVEPADVVARSTSLRKRRVLQRSFLKNESLNGSSTDADAHMTMDDNEPIDDEPNILDEKDVLINELKTENEHLKDKVTELEKSGERLQSDIYSLNVKYEESKFVNTMERDDSLTKHYTGFPSFSQLLAILAFLNPGDKCENIIAYSSNTNFKVPSSYQPTSAMDLDHNYSVSQKPLSAKEQFILVLCRLRQGFSVKHLGYLFDISESTVSRYFVSWINFMYFRLGALSIWPSKDIILKTMPQTFRDKYPDTRVIIHCSDIFAQVPDSLTLQSMFWSNYKHCITYKGLLGIAPSGAVTFVSQLYPGSMSDREIVIRSGFLEPKLFAKDDVVMADRGFTIEDLLKPMGVKLNIPAFLKGREQFETAETIETQQTAAERIHVETAINNVKKFRIFDSPFLLTMHGSINQIWTVCCLLTNCFNPVISM